MTTQESLDGPPRVECLFGREDDESFITVMGWIARVLVRDPVCGGGLRLAVDRDRERRAASNARDVCLERTERCVALVQHFVEHVALRDREGAHWRQQSSRDEQLSQESRRACGGSSERCCNATVVRQFREAVEGRPRADLRATESRLPDVRKERTHPCTGRAHAVEQQPLEQDVYADPRSTPVDRILKASARSEQRSLSRGAGREGSLVCLNGVDEVPWMPCGNSQPGEVPVACHIVDLVGVVGSRDDLVCNGSRPLQEIEDGLSEASQRATKLWVVPYLRRTEQRVDLGDSLGSRPRGREHHVLRHVREGAMTDVVYQEGESDGRRRRGRTAGAVRHGATYMHRADAVAEPVVRSARKDQKSPRELSDAPQSLNCLRVQNGTLAPVQADRSVHGVLDDELRPGRHGRAA